MSIPEINKTFKDGSSYFTVENPTPRPSTHKKIIIGAHTNLDMLFFIKKH